MQRRRQLLRHLRRHPLDSALSLAIVLLLAWALWATGQWVVEVADWRVVSANLPLYVSGAYPADQRWRPLVWLGLILTLTLVTLLWPRPRSGQRPGPMRVALPWLWLLMLPLGLAVLAGGAGTGLTAVSSRAWGGLVLTLLLTGASGLLSLPLGVILALGRTSDLPVLRHGSRLYIDLMRAVPLIAVLFFGQLLVPLFLPVELEINRVVRAVVAFALFASAYVAEDVRGGLQSIPPTQREAAAALGLNVWQSLQLVVLPQALQIAIPALTNQAIGLLQNTSLMALLGLVELLGISRSLLANPAFIGRHLEVYVWLAALYWLLCTAMALLARRLERSAQPITSTSIR